MISTKTKRNLQRIIPFGIIWVITGWVIIITEVGVTGNQNLNPETDISFTIPVLIFANIANLLVGFLVGALEVIYLGKRFATSTLRRKFFFKFVIYLLLFLVVILLFYPIAFTLETNISLFEPDAWFKLGRFLTSVSFFTTLFHLSVSLFLCLIYSAVSENLGHHVFLHFLTGKYHKPIVEERIFMFLDMKSSTTIAEALGHVQYFELLQQYYNLMADSIIDTLGEVYQYIGDEVVVSWTLEKGLKEANCIQCFFDIKNSIARHQEQLKEEFGFEIDFKAGIHMGEVTTGEVGALKKEIVFSGDVLNTSARIQGLCNALNSDLLISEDLQQKLQGLKYRIHLAGDIQLRGRHQKMKIYAVESSKIQHRKETNLCITE